MATVAACGNSVQGIGRQLCINGNPLKMPIKGVLALPGFQFDTYADFLDEDKWNEAIAAGNLFVLEKYKDVEASSIEASIIDTGSGDKIKNRDGKRGWIGYMTLTPEQNKYFQEYKNQSFTYFHIDDLNNITATSPDGIVVKGLSLSYMNIMPMEISLGTDTYSRTGIEIQLDNNDEIDKDIVVALGTDLDWQPKELYPTTLVTITNVSISTGVITASFNVVQNTIASLPSSAIRAIVATNLQFIDQTGAVVVADTITETSTPGTWEFDMTTSGMTSGSLQLIATSSSLFYSEVTAVA